MIERTDGQAPEDPMDPTPPRRRDQKGPGIGEHPKGTLLIVGIYGLLFAFGWLVLYFFVFLPRGVLTK